MMNLAYGMQEAILSLSSEGHFPNLATWDADEISYHQYYRELGLSAHKDNKRFWGMIAIAATHGTSGFVVYDREPLEYGFDSELGEEVVTKWNVKSRLVVPTRPGTLLLMRATQLYEEMTSAERPEHAVENADFERESCMIRANLKPADYNYGFDYFNWKGE